MNFDQDVLAVLHSIDDSLKKLVEFAERRQARAKESQPAIDLDHARGNPVIKAKDPRDWTGPSMQGRTFSECPPEYLDMLASRYDYFASKEDDAKKKRYNELDAARARAWAQRARNGETAPQAPAEDWSAQEPRW